MTANHYLSGQRWKDARLVLLLGAAVFALYGMRAAATVQSWKVGGDHAAPVFGARESIGQVIELQAGWNLVALSVEPDAGDPAVLLAGLISEPPEDSPLAAVWAFDRGNCEGEGEWRSFVPGRPINSLAEIELGQGLWVEMREAAEVVVVGTNPNYPLTLDLCAGDNLIGYPSGEAAPIEPLEDGALSGLSGDWTALFGEYNPATGAWRAYAPGRPFNTLAEVQPGLGYWLRLPAGATLEIEQ